MVEKYNYLESFCPLLLSHGMTKKDNVIFCKLSDKEKLLILEFIASSNMIENKLFDYIESIKKDTKHLKECYIGEQLRLELNKKVGYEYFVYDMYRLLNQLDEYLQNNELGINIHKIIDEYKQEEFRRNNVSSEINGSFSGAVLSRRGIVIQ